jgi:branched-chain amino acid transport system ATP-binding protein
MLRLENVETRYDLVYALRGVSLEVPGGTISVVLGPNGAGKSTILKTVMGLLDKQPEKGTIFFREQPIHGCRTEEIVRQGLSYVPEGRQVFEELTVEENLQVGALVNRSGRRRIEAAFSRIYDYFPALVQRKRSQAGKLSGGEQQMLAIGRALMNDPQMLLLDEPSLGLSPVLVGQIFEVIGDLARGGLTILLMEQNARQALRIADQALVLENGRFVLSGSAAELARNEDVREFYLGVKAAESVRPERRYRRKKSWR